MIKKCSLCNTPLRIYLDKIHAPRMKERAVTLINRPFIIQKENQATLSLMAMDESDITLFYALELYGRATMAEKMLVEANTFLMEHASSSYYTRMWAKELHSLWIILQEQIETTEELVRSIMYQREKNSDS